MGPLFSPTKVAVLLLLSTATACRNDTERLLDRAYQSMDADDYQTAAQLFREITITFPESPLSATAYYELAQIYHLRIRDVGAAEASLQKILSDYPQSAVVPSAHTLLGRIYERDLGLSEKAPPHYQEALQQPWIDVDLKREILLALGDCYYRLDQNEDAADSYRQALELPYDASVEGALSRLVMISRLRGDEDEALRLLRELTARTEDPTKRYQAVVEEVEILIGLKRFSDAEERLRSAETEFQHRGPELEELQTLLLQAQLDEQALETETSALEDLQKKIRWGSGRRRPREPQ